MKKRIFSVLLVFTLLGSLNWSFAAGEDGIEPYASEYLDGYAIGVNAKGGGRMSITFIVYGTDTMDKIGAQKIVVEEWDGASWTDIITYAVEEYPNFYATQAAEHGASVAFYGLPGLQYRATLTAYAEKDGGSDTGTVTSPIKTCK